MLRRLIEVKALGAIDAKDRCAYLIDCFSEARDRSVELMDALTDDGSHRINHGDFHYLEVLREAAGGPRATIPSGKELT